MPDTSEQILCSALAVCLVVSCFFVLTPKTINGGAEVTYKDSDGEYELILAFHPTNIKNIQPVESQTIRVPKDEESAIPSMLGVYKNGETVDEADFFKKVRSCTVTLEKSGDDETTVGESVYNESFLPVLRQCDICYIGQDTTDDIVWTLEMTNGDTISLRQTIEIKVLVHNVYTPNDVDLTTMEKLKDFISDTRKLLTRTR